MSKKVLWLTLLVLVASLMMLSCSGGKSAKREKGVLRLNVGPQPKTIDPALNNAVDGSVYIHHAFEGLATRDKENKIIPGTAEKWDISADGLTYTFYIRTNAKWSDGKPIVAQDFVYSWQRAVDPKTAAEYSYQFEPVKNAVAITAGKMPVNSLGVKAIDDYTLEVKLAAPTAYFLELAAFPTYFPVRKDILEANPDVWATKAETYISNGPFTVSEIKMDDSIIMVKNTNYWNAGAIVPEKLVFILMENATAAVAGIKEGSLDFARDVPPQDIPTLTKEGLAKIVPYLGTYYYVINNTNAIVKDPRIRKALSLAIDRNYIVDQVTKGGQLPASAFVPFGIQDADGSDFRKKGGDYFSVKPEDHAKNVEEAKKLLAEAGYPEGKGLPVIEFKTNPTATHISVFEAVQQMWKESLGIDSTIVQEEWAVFQQTRSDKNFVIGRHGWIGDYADPMTFTGVLLSYSSQNNGGFKSAEYDRLLKVAMSTIDQKVRMEAMHKAEDILIGEQMGLIPIYFYTNPILENPKLKGIVYDSLGSHKFFYASVE